MELCPQRNGFVKHFESWSTDEDLCPNCFGQNLFDRGNAKTVKNQSSHNEMFKTNFAICNWTFPVSQIIETWDWYPPAPMGAPISLQLWHSSRPPINANTICGTGNLNTNNRGHYDLLATPKECVLRPKSLGWPPNLEPKEITSRDENLEGVIIYEQPLLFDIWIQK